MARRKPALPPRFLGILGSAVSASLSPWMQAFFMELAHEKGCYVPFEVPPERFPKAVEGLYALGIDGFNVTVPYKERILEHLNVLSHEARTIGAVNTVVRVAGGGYLGHNTDAQGFMAALAFGFGGAAIEGSRILVIGAGGAARAVACALVRQRPGVLAIANRTLERALSLKEAASALGPTIIEAYPLGVLLEPRFVGRFDWIVQAASAEMGGGRLDIRLPRHPSRRVRAVDLVYHPPLTPFLKVAKRAGASIQNGLPMLLFQGLLAFWLFFGKKVEKNPRLLLEALEKRVRKAL